MTERTVHTAIRLELPWPAKELHPNARVHWAEKARATKKARSLAGWTTRAAERSRLCAEALAVTIVFHPPDNRPRDLDGMLSSAKSYLDGIADIVGIDDSKWSISPHKGEKIKGGRVVVEVVHG